MLWTGQLLSDTGSQIGGLAYPLLILALTQSAVLAGAVGTVRAITGTCLQLPAGALSRTRRPVPAAAAMLRLPSLLRPGSPAAANPSPFL